ncbi:MAG: hypothetical protein A2509_09265 [Candidatus Edwardsbacteria bacterium RIFOXYD12_FULL_50_11]|uniref:Uncharacterized protein n=1 Tax=Candidatus Edwardsbacteria bacterium GWF2_54_11 TaxID=1817851 RepID=A0A1F5R5P6_9BACT|nr:MAG: hypothetical protein A2502_08605 [Candidatus Edwardsbacteria bacterium RifOxyC12_full_54_24]OGF07351.1 MAG: hypothetical protein A2273_02450 [Candidatus Edwardsbacteria bacterium RifOxyA12_full_54_48]OGF09343.1 MAG: hypothetical protein A2024_08650 [Candidatus Edwardsbacteria bacterium GWF2_54_11]OGF09603.1 MAG: hypothetical protein A3K15_08860 [Candidatus Edwardsbacteria bacterium GWE2_54_12]OGF18046.1 MAG: hypothetical protein A2509_09265 [Candidatus Edwardsbacteria bacterium RIFOXYD1
MSIIKKEDSPAIIRTSDPGWLDRALKSYRDRLPFHFTDDANLGITESDLVSAVSLIRRAGRTGKASWKEISQILTGMGLSGVGIWLIAASIASPEPTSKLWILLAGGVVLITTGGLSILKALGQKWQVHAKYGKQEIMVSPGDDN